ncbi:MAG: DegT/DnrJ/EryC1/StrS family aminotransferase [Planctomycetota bacterium]
MPSQDVPRRLTLPSDRDASGRDLGAAELEHLAHAIRSGHLIATAGHFGPRLERAFAERFGVSHAVACASGSAAVHAAIATLRVRPGDEIVTSPITDMGAVMPICYEGAKPVFADVDPRTGNVDASTLERVLGPRTRAVIVTHLFGQPCDMEPIVALCRRTRVTLIEDVAQAFLATDHGRLCGSFGDFACFSFQQGKHMTTGEGGMVIAAKQADADAARRFVNKGWGYGDAEPDHDRPGLNFRLTELQAAVGVAQLEKLDGVVQRRRERAAQLCESLRGLAGIALPDPLPGTAHSYWRFLLRVDARVIRGGASALGALLGARGIGNAPHYVKKPAFECAVFRNRGAFAPTRLAFGDDLEGPLGDAKSHPGVYASLAEMLVLAWNEHYTQEHVAQIADAVRQGVRELATVGAGRG